jgi:hypothetical protein
MVEVEDLPGVHGKKRRLAEFVGELVIRAEGQGFRVRADKACWDLSRPGGKRSLLAFSGVGTGTEVRAVRAALGVNHDVEFEYRSHRRGRFLLYADADGYKTFARAIGLRQFHLIAVSARPGFLPSGDLESLWQFVQQATTTPLDRRWVEVIERRMKVEERFAPIDSEGDGFTPALLDGVDDAYMDELVSRMVRGGNLTIEG